METKQQKMFKLKQDLNLLFEDDLHGGGLSFANATSARYLRLELEEMEKDYLNTLENEYLDSLQEEFLQDAHFQAKDSQ